jgi:predicted RNase H-like HicB family nuclease
VQRYAVVIHEEPEGGFWGEVPALPGCYSQGETVEELISRLREAITGVCEVAEQGDQPGTGTPKPGLAQHIDRNVRR